jgi:murein endopeptidase
LRALLALLALAGSAHAERYVIQRGETLEHVATAKGCSVERLMRANGLRTTLVKAGTTINVPACTLRTRARARTVAKPKTDAEKARAALSVIDGATWTVATRDDEVVDEKPRRPVHTGSSDRPWHGTLTGAERLPGDEGYRIRRPSRAYGVSYVIDHLKSTIGIVRALYPDVHTLAIGDLSAEHGGKLDNHRSHQTGLDVDVGFYFRTVPDGYPAHFAAADGNLDLEATWALITAFARTQALDDGVEIIFLDHAVQKKLYDWAHARGTPDDDLAQLFQYPRGRDRQVGLVRHWPNHADHLHVRFKSRR